MIIKISEDNKNYIITLIFAAFCFVIGIVFTHIFLPSQCEEIASIECQITHGKFYYHPNCGWCQRQINEGGLEELQNMGVSLEIIDLSKGNYSFIEASPAWMINDELSYGYKTLDQLKIMFGCG